MRISGWLILIVTGTILFAHPGTVRAVEEGQFVKKEGKWEYYSSEDPGLKYLYLKGLITEAEYNKGLRVLETKERLAKPNFNIDVNNGLNIRVGDRFFLKMRLLVQTRYTYSTYNQAWGSIGDSRNEEILGGQVEFRAFRRQSDSSQFLIPRARLQFMGYAFDPEAMPLILTFVTTSPCRWIQRHRIKKEATAKPDSWTPTCHPGTFLGPIFNSDNKRSGSIVHSSVTLPHQVLRTT